MGTRSAIVVFASVLVQQQLSFAAFDANGIEHFAGTVKDTSTWRQWTGGSYAGTVTQNDALSLRTYDTSTGNSGLADYMTKQVRLNPGQFVQAEVRVSDCPSGPNRTGLYITSGDGSAQIYDSAQLGLIWDGVPGSWYYLKGMNGNGSASRSEQFYYGAVYTPNAKLLLRIDWLAAQTVQYSAWENSTLLGTLQMNVTEWNNRSNLYIDLHAEGTNITFDNVAYGNVPEPSACGLIALLAGVILQRDRRQHLDKSRRLVAR